MDQIPTQQFSPGDEGETTYDVEAHGLKEVAAGLGAAAVLAGGAASVAQFSESAPVLPEQDVASLSTSVDDAVDDGLSQARDARDQAVAATLATATQAIATTIAASDTAMGEVDQLGQATGRIASVVAAEVTRTADRHVQGVTRLATTTEERVGTIAQRASATVDSAASTVLTVANNAQQQVAAMVTISADVTPDGSARLAVTPHAIDGTTLADDTWVMFQVGGNTVGKAQFSGGQASATLDARALHGQVLTVVSEAGAALGSILL